MGTPSQEFWSSVARSRQLLGQSAPQGSRTRTIGELDEDIAALKELVLLAARHRNEQTAVLRVPSEIISMVFHILREDDKEVYWCQHDGTGFKEFEDSRLCDTRSSLLHIPQVCHRWRKLALEDSLLWSDIHVSRMSVAWIKERLYRAGNAPLSLSLQWKPDNCGYMLQTFEAIVDSNFRRIKTIRLEVSSSEFADIVLSDDMPALELVHLAYYINEDEDLNTTSLPSFSNVGGPLPWDFIPYSQLLYLTLDLRHTRSDLAAPPPR
ncbi:hypothetical protein OF83DRAFT_844431 [Amylostereum chailletii]|nr:hypothetical protein OF83DRAFT_844431 [Amylostereum chailletii]